MELLPAFVGTPERNRVYHCDALTLLRALPSGSVEALISDFPYNTTACEWESDIGVSSALWAEIWRVVKENGAVITTASQPFTSLLIMNQLKRFRHEWIWEKSLATGYLNANRAPMKAHESVLVFSKQAANYYPQKVAGKPYRATRGAVGGHVRDKTVGGYVTENDGSRFPRSVLRFASAENPLHPTQKPISLYEYLVSTYTQIGDLVCDPFCGSGTTALAARNLQRDFIAGDITAEYVEIARRRLAQPYTVNMFAAATERTA